MKVKFDELEPHIQRFLTIVPRRAPVDWEIENGRVVIVYPKDFNRFERWLHRFLGGPTIIRRPLDKMGTDIWKLCDGRHMILDICNFMDAKYQEEMEPVLDRVKQFLEMLAVRNLIILGTDPRRPLKQRVMKKREPGTGNREPTKHLPPL